MARVVAERGVGFVDTHQQGAGVVVDGEVAAGQQVTCLFRGDDLAGESGGACGGVDRPAGRGSSYPGSPEPPVPRDIGRQDPAGTGTGTGTGDGSRVWPVLSREARPPVTRPRREAIITS